MLQLQAQQLATAAAVLANSPTPLYVATPHPVYGTALRPACEQQSPDQVGASPPAARRQQLSPPQEEAQRHGYPYATTTPSTSRSVRFVSCSTGGQLK